MNRTSGHRVSATFVTYFFMLFLAMLCLMLGTYGLIVSHNEALLQEALSGANRYTLERVRDMVDILISESERAALLISTEEDIESLANEDSFQFDQYEKIERLARAHRFMELLTGSNAYIESVYIYFRTSGYVCASGIGAMKAALFFDSAWLADVDALLSGNRIVSRIRKPTYDRPTSFRLSSPYYLTTYCPLSTPNKQKGLVLVNTDIRALGNLFTDHASGDGTNRLYITDAENKILFSQSDGDIGVVLDTLYDLDMAQVLRDGSLRFDLEGQPHLVNAMDSNYNAFRYYTISNMNEILRESRRARLYAMGVLMAGIGFLFVLSMIMAYRFYRPVKDVLTVLDAPGDWSRRSKRQKRSPVSHVCDRILYNIAQNETLERELTERMQLLQSAQNIALKSQLNPHFLYNTLDVINWKVRQLTHGENSASEMITLLSQLLHASLDTRERLVPLEREMEIARLYVRINEIRKPDRFKVTWQVDDGLAGFSVLPMMLQPLLENAVQHGFAGAGSDCQMTVSAALRPDALEIAVQDNGRGMDEKQLAAVRADLAEGKLDASGHIGLTNVHRRIQLMFGPEYGLSLISLEGIGTTVTIVLPRIAGLPIANPPH
ncbi:MAG TPA: sensor histidine kinase [Clostridia bacterium]|nr:sensor histidine kinase [Clostridia bacterium]